MAEPLILAYGRGELPEFPASPDSVIDIVPCDYVVNAIVAVCATEPEPGEPAYYHVSSGARNPLTFSDMYAHIRQLLHSSTRWSARPSPASRCRSGSSPGAASVERLLSTSERAYTLADARGHPGAALGPDPASSPATSIGSARRLTFVRRYHSLYNEYAQSELHFVDDNTLALSQALRPATTRLRSPSTPRSSTGRPTSRRCTALGHRLGAPDGRAAQQARARPTTMKDLSKDTAGARAVAIFDLDGTIMSTNVVEQYLWARLPELTPPAQLAEVAQVDPPAARLPAGRAAGPRQLPARGLPALPRAGPRRAGAPGGHHDGPGHPQPARPPEALQRITEHRAAGHTTILITGAVRTFTRPLREFFDVIVAAELAVDDDGRCTGFLTTPPLVGESRAAWLKHYAALHGIDLSRSFAYADSPLRPADAVDGWQPGRGQPGHPADAGRPAQPVVDRGVEDQADHAPLADPPLTPRPCGSAYVQISRFRVAACVQREDVAQWVQLGSPSCPDTPSGRPPSTRRP